MSEPRISPDGLAARCAALTEWPDGVIREGDPCALDLRDEREKNARLREALRSATSGWGLEPETPPRALAGDSTLPPGFSIHDGADATKDTPFGPGIVVGDSTPTPPRDAVCGPEPEAAGYPKDTET